jgi:two-component system nitrogen regulation response regulator NtrX
VKPTVLVVDDDPHIVESISTTLKLQELAAEPARSVSEARRVLESRPVECAVVDVALGDEHGADLLEWMRAARPMVPVIMISGVASVEEALETVRMGATDFIEKPIRPERLLVAVRNAVELARLRAQTLDEAVPVAGSPAMQEVVRKATQAAGAKTTVLISGESGVGKDRLARLIHGLSPRATGPFVKINCGALPEALAESELFGHTKGAFTGAVSAAPGKIAGADGGTLFLDEIGELSLAIQVKLLRFLESGEIQRVGDHHTGRVDARLVAATNRDLEADVQAGRFRADLFYRLNVVPLTVPPLRERPEEIPPLVRHCAAEIASNLGVATPTVTDEAVEALSRRSYPGNVRELRNTVERLLVLSEGTQLTAEHVAGMLDTGSPSGTAAGGSGQAPTYDGERSLLATPMPLSEARRELERRYLRAQLAAHGGSVQRTAEALSMKPNNLSRRLGELGISPREA